MTPPGPSPDHLEPLALPASADQWSTWVDERCFGSLGEALRLATALTTTPPAGALEALEAWNQVCIALSNAAGAAAVLSETHPDLALRQRAETAVQDADKLRTDLSLNRELYAVLAALDSTGLDPDASRLLSLTMRDFTRAGVDRDDMTRERVRALAEQETDLGQEFSRNIRGDVRTVRLRGKQLAGLPDDYVAAHPADHDGWHTISTDYPDAYPFLTFAEDPEGRHEVYVEFLSRGWPANDDVLRSLLTTRHEHATMLGFANWADYDAEIKMIGRGTAIADFIERVSAAADEPGRRDRDVLLQRLRQDRPEAEGITGADNKHYAELVRRESYAVDARLTRTYFDFAKVRRGLLDVTGRLFGLDYTPVEDAACWHPDVTAYDVHRTGSRIGRIYLDLHPREGKFKHAAQFDWVRGVDGRQLPEGVLVCNFPRGLMEHSDVITFFHEFGHLVHHVLAGCQQWVRFSGVATEWDFVEAPSQLLEEWAWNADVLQTFATNADGDAIPAALVAQMRAAHDFGKGYLARTQMFYAALSYSLHLGAPEQDLTELVASLQPAYDLFSPVDGTHFHTAFGHLESYTSAYYTYMWSLVIAKDLLSAFDGDDLFDSQTARRYRDRILVPGGSKDAADLVEDFLGRPYDDGSFREWLARPGADARGYADELMG